MGNSGHIHRGATAVLSLAMLVIGVALIVQVVAGHGGVISGRMLLGLLFVAAGTMRLYVESRRGRSRATAARPATPDVPARGRRRRRSAR